MKTGKSVIILILCVLAAFGITVCVVTAKGPIAFDENIRQFFLSLRCDGLTVIAKAITQLGSVAVVVSACILLLIIPKTRMKIGIPVAAAVSLSQIVRITVQNAVGRARPPLADRLVTETSYSFPSGHGISSMVLYGLLIYMVRKYVKKRMTKNLLTVLLAVPAVFIGVSRVYLSVHYPTDVLGAWSMAIAIVAGTVIVTDTIDGKGKEK